MNTLDQIETALNAARDYFQASHRDFAALRDAGAGCEQRINELAALIESTRHEIQIAREATTALETALRTRLDDGEQRLSEYARTLTTLQAEQEQLTTRDGRMAEQAATLQTTQESLTALDGRVTAQAERFGQFETALRQLHGELAALHERLAALEAPATAQLLDEHARRLDEAEQRDREQRQTLTELEQALEQVASRQPVPGKSNALLGILIIAVMICAVLTWVILNTGAR